MLTDDQLRDVRLSALLHDVGHGPFSHVSEAFFASYPEMKSKLSEPIFAKCEPKPHEVLSYLIVTSKAFKKFLDDNLLSKDYREAINLARVGDLIIGNVSDRWQEYLADIVNGAFDSDKFDYILRDCYFTGIRMTVDVNRIFHTVSIDKMKSYGRQGLVVDISGSIFIEQILFNKMLLFSSLYHHHKERAAECMLKSIFEAVRDYKLEINGFRLNRVADFLSLTDNDVLCLEGKPEPLVPLIKNLLHRNLLKRALVISRKTIKTTRSSSKKRVAEVHAAHHKLLSLGKDYAKVKELRQLIADEVGECTVYDIWLDLPDPPSFREAKQALIKITDKERKRLDKIFPISKWLETYAENKWKGHVFCPPIPKIRKKVGKIAQKVIREALDIEFSELATDYAKME